MGDTSQNVAKKTESVVTETKQETSGDGTVTATKTTEVRTETKEDAIVVEKRTVVNTETITNGDMEDAVEQKDVASQESVPTENSDKAGDAQETETKESGSNDAKAPEKNGDNDIKEPEENGDAVNTEVKERVNNEPKDGTTSKMETSTTETVTEGEDGVTTIKRTVVKKTHVITNGRVGDDTPVTGGASKDIHEEVVENTEAAAEASDNNAAEVEQDLPGQDPEEDSRDAGGEGPAVEEDSSKGGTTENPTEKEQTIDSVADSIEEKVDGEKKIEAKIEEPEESIPDNVEPSNEANETEDVNSSSKDVPDDVPSKTVEKSTVETVEDDGKTTIKTTTTKVETTDGVESKTEVQTVTVTTGEDPSKENVDEIEPETEVVEEATPKESGTKDPEATIEDSQIANQENSKEEDEPLEGARDTNDIEEKLASATEKPFESTPATNDEVDSVVASKESEDVKEIPAASTDAEEADDDGNAETLDKEGDQSEEEQVKEVEETTIETIEDGKTTTKTTTVVETVDGDESRTEIRTVTTVTSDEINSEKNESELPVEDVEKQNGPEDKTSSSPNVEDNEAVQAELEEQIVADTEKPAESKPKDVDAAETEEVVETVDAENNLDTDNVQEDIEQQMIAETKQPVESQPLTSTDAEEVTDEVTASIQPTEETTPAAPVIMETENDAESSQAIDDNQSGGSVSDEDEHAIAEDIEDLISQEKASAIEAAIDLLNSDDVAVDEQTEEDNFGKRVEFPTKTGTKEAYMCGEPNVWPRGIIVLHQKAEVTDALKADGSELSTDGNFTVLLLNVTPTNNKQDWLSSIEVVASAAKYLLESGCQSVGAAGFGNGAAVTLIAALKVTELSAAAPFYGCPPPNETKDLTHIEIPIQTHWGGDDTRREEEELVKALQDAGLSIDCYTYDCGHEFCDVQAKSHNREQRDIAYRRLCSFMQENLQVSVM